MNELQSAVAAVSLCKTYETYGAKLEILKDVNFDIAEGGFTVLSGPSGSGKTTLLNLIGGIDKPTSGEILVFGEDLKSKNEDFLSSFRCSNIGFVFQNYNLVSTLTVDENIAFPMEWARKREEQLNTRVEELLEIVGLRERREHFPFQLSGGEQQRVAFARALANDPRLFLVDEPTGNLDKTTSSRIVQVLKKLKHDGKTLVVATHDEHIFELADQKLSLENGRLTSKNG